MNRLDRALGILLLLRDGKTISAAELSQRFEVSTRTIYRDVEMLASVGVPIYAEMGRAGGFRLVEGYFLPPVMFSVGEAVSLLLGLTLLRRLRARPFAAELETSEQKLLAAVPDQLRAALAHAQQIIGFERLPADIFHPERLASEPTSTDEGAIISVFVRAILDRTMVALDYHSPYGDLAEQFVATPQGLLWDRDRWYLIGERGEDEQGTRLWRADRVLRIAAHTATARDSSSFDVSTLLDRRWLRPAMERWRSESPVTIRLTRSQAERLRQDWYYRHALFEELAGDRVQMTFGEDDRAVVLELLRWLGPGAELVAPKAWRAALRAELSDLLDAHADGGEEQATKNKEQNVV
jgi:predicted DNA-binding transcriptional regulator YafY